SRSGRRCRCSSSTDADRVPARYGKAPMSNRFIFGRVIGTAWMVIDGIRKLLHLFLLLVLVLIVVAAVSRPGPRVPDAAALLTAPQGILVDQLSGDPFDRALARVQGETMRETLLKDLIDAIR